MDKRIFLIALAALVILFVACSKPQTAQTAIPAAPEITQPQQPVTPAETQPQEKPVTEVLSNGRCVGTKIEMTVTNTMNENFTINKDARFLWNGMVVSNPECDKMTIAPGETVYCSNIAGYFTVKKGSVNKIQLNIKSGNFDTIVQC